MKNSTDGRRYIPRTPCVRCGWAEGPVDSHRIVPELGYVTGNTVSLCPNCHRLVTFGITEI